MAERLSKWLLTTRDRVMSDEFRLTQEDLSNMMGAHRPNVTVAARALLDAGIIKYSRGQISILDHKGLQAASCECYQIVKSKIDRFFTH
jgi:DNA-binding Lrp family transcriptional regulator